MKVMLVGSGNIGAMIVEMLMGSGDYQVTLADRTPELLARVNREGLEKVVVDAEDSDAVARALKGHDAVISAAPYTLTPSIAAAARKAGVHYFDLTEDVAATRVVKGLAAGASSAFVPQCGLAPGFISIAAHDLAKRFDSLTDLHMRVGALPLYPTNGLKYNLTWSTDGLINEYCNPCEAIVDGQMREVLPLEGLEHFSLDGLDYEAFNTSGGLGTLCETLEGRVGSLDYKTVRYPGHREIVKLLVQDLGLGKRRPILKDILENAIPMTLQDVVLVFVTASGQRDGRLTQDTFVRKVYAKEIGGRMWSAIQVTTAAGICAMVDLMREGRLPNKGFVRQEQADLADILANRFGRHYA